MRLSKLSLAGLAALAVSACNQTTTTAQAPVPVANVAVANASLPAGAACTGSIGRFRAVIENDSKTGHVSPSVYSRMEAEVNQAEAACAAGRDAEATRMLATTRARYGYPG